MDISFRLMCMNDLQMISEWENTPDVKQWYGKDYTSRDQIEQHYQKELEETPRLTWHYIIQIDNRDAGMIQTYLLSSYPDMDKHIQTGVGSSMVDVFLAPPFMHKGYGSFVMRKFLNDVVFSGKHFTSNKCTIGPEPKNLSAIRMYEKSGFRWIKTIQIPDETEPEYIMLIHKDEII